MLSARQRGFWPRAPTPRQSDRRRPLVAARAGGVAPAGGTRPGSRRSGAFCPSPVVVQRDRAASRPCLPSRLAIPDDLSAIADRVREIDPTIRTFIVPANQRNTLIRSMAAERPTLVVSAGRMRKFRATPRPDLSGSADRKGGRDAPPGTGRAAGAEGGAADTRSSPRPRRVGRVCHFEADRYQDIFAWPRHSAHADSARALHRAGRLSGGSSRAARPDDSAALHRQWTVARHLPGADLDG